MPIIIKNIFIRMARRYPNGFEISDGRVNAITDEDRANDDDTGD